MKLIVAGGRDFDDYEKLRHNINAFRSWYDVDEIVSGCASGADKLGEKYALLHGLKIKQFPADWSKHGKSAGPIRNKQMVEYADACICFWDNESKGTKSMINLAMAKGLVLKIISYK